MDLFAFYVETPATHLRVSPEDFGDLVNFDSLSDKHWPVWVALRDGEPVAWYCEYNELAAIPFIASHV